MAFDDVFDSQKTFRILLDSMSRPGRCASLPACSHDEIPDDLNPFLVTVLRTLCDNRVSFSFPGGSARAAWIRFLQQNCTAPFMPPERADFVLCEGSRFSADFASVKRGTLEFPQSSATALIAVTRLSEEGEPAGPAPYRLTLTGPGIKGSTCVVVSGLDRRYGEERARLNHSFPLGVDLILVDEAGRVVCIPRTSGVQVD
jgi:alpha-D-ribose 1-methylphosphonate 5-triphosphate synthase subunit PhnH